VPAGDVAPPENRQMARKDLKKLQGTWERVAMEVEGEEVPDEHLKGWVAIHEADQLILKVDGKIYRRGVITLNPTRTPKAINTWDSDGPNRDQTLPGIYELKGDTLKKYVLPSRASSDQPNSQRSVGRAFYAAVTSARSL